MPERYLSDVLRTFPSIAHHTAPLSGVEATMYNRLWELIIDGKLRPGTKLREDVIGETFSVSRTLVRKVLIIMEQEGIVQLPPNHGAFVATPTPEQARDVCEAVRVIGVHAVSELARKGSAFDEENAERLKKQIAYQIEAEAAGDFYRARKLSGEFHILLVQMQGNRILAAQFEILITRLAMAMLLYQDGRYQPPRVPFQKDLMERLQKHDQKGAVALVQEFYHSIERSLRFEAAEEEVDLRAVLTATDLPVEKKPARKRGRSAKLKTS